MLSRLTAHELALPSSAGCLPPPVVDLAFPLSPSPIEGAHAAFHAWRDHVAAARIGTPAPAPAPQAGELRLASLARILGHRR